MKRFKYPERPLSPEEENRLIEIEFVHVTDELFEVFGDTTQMYDFVDIMCEIAHCSVTVIRTATTNVRSLNSTLRASKEELAIFLYRSGVPVAKISKRVNLAPMSIYRTLQLYYNSEERKYLPRMKQDLLPQLKAYTEVLKKLTHYDELNL